MRHVLTLFVIGLFAAACGEANRPPPATGSPLLEFDKDRLWILLRASRVGDGRGCAEVFLRADGVQDTSRLAKCQHWSKNFAHYLAVNGLPTIEAAHLESPAYWSWFRQARQTVANCKSAVGNLKPDATSTARATHTLGKFACDPYDDALHNRSMTVESLGIRYPDV